MKRYINIIGMGILFTAHMVCATDISCDNRMRHGPKGLLKGAVAMLSAYAAYQVASDLKDVCRQLKAQNDIARRDVVLYPWVAACALVSLSYVAWKLALSSKESLQIYLDDSLDDAAYKPADSQEKS